MSSFPWVFRAGAVSHLQRPTIWKRKTIIFDQHTPSKLSCYSFLPVLFKWISCLFFQSIHFPLFFISLANLSLLLSYPSWAFRLTSSSFSSFFLWPFPFGVFESRKDLFVYFFFTPWFLSLVCFYDIHLPSVSLVVTIQALYSPVSSFWPFYTFLGLS